MDLITPYFNVNLIKKKKKKNIILLKEDPYRDSSYYMIKKNIFLFSILEKFDPT